MGNFSEEFLKIAKETKESKWGNKSWIPSDEGFLFNDDDAYGLETCRTHCGTCEFRSIHIPSLTFERIVPHVCFNITRAREGHFLYYQPHNKKYKHGVEIMQKLLATPVYSFQHLDYLKRSPDKGWCTLWSKQYGPKDIKLLEAL